MGAQIRRQLAIFYVMTLLVAVLPNGSSCFGDDWPVFQQNNQRNAKSLENLDSQKLSLAWTWKSSGPPESAWSGPAKWDAYAGIKGLKSMRNYDPVFHVVSVGDRVWFASSVEECVRCLDAATGKEIWVFYAEGPVRIAPAYADGKVYFGSDDGFAYCVDANHGQLVWKFQPRPTKRKVLNNGRLISQWPIRTGVLVDDGIAYFGASLLPWEKSYLCAVDALTGSHEGDGLYVNEMEDATMEGPLAIAPGKLLIAPQGRVPPQMFQVSDGKSLGSLSGGGGSFVVLTKDSVFHGPGNKTGWLTASNLQTRETVASFQSGNAMIVAGDTSLIQTDHAISAANYATRQPTWSTDCECPFTMALAGNTIFTGGQDQVVAYSANDGKRQGRIVVDGKAYGLAIANGTLFVSTDTGAIHAFHASDQIAAADANDTSTSEAGSTSIENLEGLVPVPPFESDQLVNRWVFQRPHVQGLAVEDLAGDSTISVNGRIQLFRTGSFQSAKCDNSIGGYEVTRDVKSKLLPQREFTAEAWVRIDEPLTWGGIIGCLQDNGDFERGWLLGYSDDRFLLAVKGVNSAGGLTYLKAKQPFATRAWHHVVGTYDGQQMRLYVDGKLAAESSDQSGDIQYADQHVYQIAGYRDDNENYPMTGMLNEIRVYHRAISDDEVEAGFKAKANGFPAASPLPDSPEFLQVAAGPWSEFTASDEVTIRWRTATPAGSHLNLYLDGQPVQETRDTQLVTEHEVVLNSLGRHRVYEYELLVGHDQPEDAADGAAAGSGTTQRFELDTFFNYSPSPFPAEDQVFWEQNTSYAKAADHILSQANVDRGLCVVLGCGDGTLIYELAKRSQFRFAAFDPDADRAARVRHDLQLAGLYGTRVTIHRVSSLQEIPATGRIANLVVSESIMSGDETTVSLTEAARLLAPQGLAILGRTSQGDEWLTSDNRPFEVTKNSDGCWATFRQPAIAGAGDWGHIYGQTDNSHYGGEALSDVSASDELVVQWVGRPGARYQSDRNGRKTPPLATGGKIFLQGLDRIITLDQYNGQILWALDVPEFRRFNMPRDCGNWCASDEFLFAAVRDKCWRIDAKTGTVQAMLDVLPADAENPFEWGYIGLHNRILIGSSVVEGNLWKDFWGKEAWYDGTSGPVAAKVCSDNIFGVDPISGEAIWEYQSGVIINASIIMSDDSLFFVENENPDFQKGANRRLDGAEFWKGQVITVLDPNTGEVKWKKEIDTEDGEVAFYASYGNGTIVLVASKDKHYHIYALDERSGEQLWHQQIQWGKGAADHGSHLSRPAIVGDKLFVRPAVFDLRTGKKQDLVIPVAGCGTYAVTDKALFFRGGSGQNSAVWDSESGKYTMWNRLRPDCWLSTIPAGGMLLSPEGGGGCSCGKWMETSLGFIPKSQLTGYQED